MRVGFLIDRWDPRRGGAERALALLANHLAGRGADVRVFAREGDLVSVPGVFHRVGVSWPHRLTRTRLERKLARSLAAAARAEACDVTIGIRHLEHVDLFWPHGGSHAASLAARARSRGRASDGAPRGRHRLFLELERRLVTGGARRIVCVSDLVRAELQAAYPGCEERLVVIENGVDLELFHPRNRETTGALLRARLEVPKDQALIAFLGRDPVTKGLRQLLEACRRLGDRRWQLLAAGPRHPGRWMGTVARLGLAAPRVRVEEFVPGAELLAAADLVVVPTWRDTYLLVVLEALASGTPVVTTRHAGAAALLGPDTGSVLAEPDDVEALAGGIAGWLDRIEGEGVDRSVLRAVAEKHGEGPWLERMEAQVRALAAGSERAS